MPRCVFCNKDTELVSHKVGDVYETQLLHVATGLKLCLADPAKGFPSVKYREIDGNVYRVKNDRLGEFVGKLEDIADVYLLHQESEETSKD